MREAVVVDMMRTPFGKAGQRGVFRDITHVEMVVPLLKGILERNNVGAEEVDEILMGSVGIAGMLTRSRHYVFEAGLPFSISATDMNKQCGSSLQACTQGAFAVMAGMSDIVLAGGVETMDRVQPIAPGDERNLGQIQTADVMSKEMLPNEWPGDKKPKWNKRWYQATEPWIMDMGATAEKLARERGISREDSDRFSLESHKRAIRAQKEGLAGGGDPADHDRVLGRIEHEGRDGPEPARGYDARKASDAKAFLPARRSCHSRQRLPAHGRGDDDA